MTISTAIDDRQRTEHPGGPQQRALTRGEGATGRRRAVTAASTAGTAGRRRAGRWRSPRRVGAADGMAAGAARPIGRRLVGPRGPAAGPHRGDGVGERTAAAVAHAGVLDQRDLDEFAHVGRQVGGQRGGRLLDVLHRHRQRAVAGERPLARNRFVANDSQRVHIAGRGGVVTQRLFGGDVLGGAHHHAGLGHRRGVDGLGDTEVGELHLAGRGDQDVARFDVAVHQAGGVRDLQCAAGLLEHVQRVPQRQPAGAFEHRVQRLAVDEFHHQIGGAALAVHIGFAVVVHAGDAGMVEHRDGAGLGAEPFDELRVRGVLGFEHLDGDAPAEPAVDGLPHLAHAAGGDEALQPVAAGQRHTYARAHDPP